MCCTVCFIFLHGVNRQRYFVLLSSFDSGWRVLERETFIDEAIKFRLDDAITASLQFTGTKTGFLWRSFCFLSDKAMADSYIDTLKHVSSISETYAHVRSTCWCSIHSDSVVWFISDGREKFSSNEKKEAVIQELSQDKHLNVVRLFLSLGATNNGAKDMATTMVLPVCHACTI